ncbi:hypothetical protein FRC14_006098 [Serendipita sp. 396]|nr:hypothetical protein FRC14_006098 [Serendipita sp. 396]KAG8786775.1 hypothetical protein FRC15_010717 [Serendipita sp. 397]KAG8802345.1 hypothetical protein FRC16_009868 [Serendipita sp. 398]KAG8838003.1 hypothetical protein FRC18_006836 [Serendipita sp. 400]KAG8855455.1 hypothetical protein FRB91_002169 [Serendipita sp. 411]KAG8871533.1 hypothetical protein FRC20_010441 [Serendipita sp. 405]
MASSASEDERILRDLEELDQLRRKEAVLREQLERAQKAIKQVEKRVEQKRNQFTERPHQSRRQAVNLSCLSSWRQEDDDGVGSQLTRSRTTSGNIHHSTLSSDAPNALGLSTDSHPEPSSNVNPNRKTMPPSTIRTKLSTLITDASQTCTAGAHSDDESSRKDSSVDGIQDPPRKMAYKTLVARKYSLQQGGSLRTTLPPVNLSDAENVAPQSASIQTPTGPNLASALSYVPTTALDAKMTLERISLVRGFNYTLRTSLLQPDTLTATMIEWPALMPSIEMVRMFESLCLPHSEDCRCSPTAGDRTLRAVETPTACEKSDLVKRAISAFIGAAIIAGFSLTDLQEMWKGIKADQWINRYIVKRDRDLVRLGATVVLERIEKEMAKLNGSGGGFGSLVKGAGVVSATKVRQSVYDSRRGSSATIIGYGRRF